MNKARTIANGAVIPACLALTVMVLSGCTGMIREGRKSENVGMELYGNVESTVLAVEETLRAEGYKISKSPNAKGPGMAGMDITGILCTIRRSRSVTPATVVTRASPAPA